jgi:hypothetical protein
MLYTNLIRRGYVTVFGRRVGTPSRDEPGQPGRCFAGSGR